MKKRIGVVLLSAIIFMGGCNTDSAGDGVYLIMDTAEAENASKAIPERQSSEACPETSESSAETTGDPAETAAVYTETTESSREKEQTLPVTEETGAEAVAEPAVQAPDGYITETSRFSGTLIGSDSAASKLEVVIDIPFGKKCAVGSDGRVHIDGADWYEDNSVYAYFADYEYYTEEIIAEMLEGERSDDWLIDTRAEKALTDAGEEFYIQISRFYEDESYTELSSVIVDGIYILDNGHHLDWSYIDRGETDFDDFVSDAIKSLKSAEFTEYIPDRAEIDQVELDAIIEALIQAGEIQTEFPWRAEVADARGFEDKTTLDLRKSAEPNVLDVTVSGENVTVRDMLNVHVLHTDVVGRFGSPVEVTGTSEGSVITFRADRRGMKNVPLQNLIVLHYDEENAWYDELPSCVDEELYAVSAVTDGDGCYLLADLYEWYGVWGFPIPDGSEHTVEAYGDGGSY